MLKIRKMMKSQKGFTLVELIVVIAILGILAALVVPRFVGTLKTQSEKTDLANIRTVQSAYDLYLADHNGKVLTDGLVDALKGGEGGETKYLDDMPTMKSEKFEGGDWGVDGTSVTYDGKTYSDWVNEPDDDEEDE